MAPSFVYVITREDPEGGLAVLSAHATQKSANDAASEESGTAEVEKVELIGGTITKSKATASGPSKKMKEASAELPSDVNSGALEGQTVLFTGELARLTRAEAKQMAESAGAATAGSVTKAVTLVVLGQRAGPDKMKKIEKMGLETIDEDGFLEMIKGDGAVAGSKRVAADDDECDEEEEEKPAPKKRSKKAKA